MKRDLSALVHLLSKLLDMRAELIDRLATKIDGGQMALVATVDGAVAAVESEIERRSNED